MFRKLIPFLLIALLVASCASSGVDQRRQLRALIEARQFDQAIAFLDQDKFYQKDKQRLLLLIEKGILLHKATKYEESLVILEQAKQKADELYTVSIRGKIASGIINDNSDIFYGESYELSMMFYYKALNHFLIYSRNPKVNDHLFKARASILAWDSHLESLRQVSSGKSVYKDDIMAKLFGGFIHEVIGTSTELEIALQLYKDAEALLIKNYSAYKTFNSQFVKFIKNFEKFPKLGRSKVEKDFVAKTDFFNELNNFLDFKILRLSRIVRPRNFKRVARQIKASQAVQSAVKKIKKNHLKSNVRILINNGLIPRKIASKQYFGLGGAAAKNNAAVAIGGAIITLFAANELGLLPPPGHYNPIGAQMGYNVASVVVDNAAIRFELPVIEPFEIKSSSLVKIYKFEGDEKKLVQSFNLNLINPMGDIAAAAIEEKSASRYTRLGTRLATKHIAAIASSYATYKMMSKGDSKGFARTAAVLQYAALSKGIEYSEKADVRQVISLPSDIRMGELYLAPGEYEFEVIVKKGALESSFSLGKHTVTDGKTQLIFKNI